jgi:DNA-binding transcriptional MerR regulator
MNQTDVPEKVFYRIGEISRIAGVKPHVLRYWETVFGAIRPEKTGSGQRLYKRRDLEAVLKIKSLLYEERYTIAGAKKAIRDLDDSVSDKQKISRAVTELKAIRELLSE